MASILFADLSGFTALTEAHGDLDAAAIATRFTDLASSALDGDARVLKTMGDEVMIVASTPAEAVRTALALASAVEAETEFPAVRAGINHGPVVKVGEDLFGGTVNLAARVASHARGGQVLCTATVADGLTGSDISIAPAGTQRFKNIAGPVELFWLAPGRQHDEDEIDPVCHMRIDPTRAQGRLDFEGRTWWFCSLGCVRTFAADPLPYTTR